MDDGFIWVRMGPSSVMTILQRSHRIEPSGHLRLSKNGKETSYYMPLRMMRADKPNPTPNVERIQKEDWPWAMPTYELVIDTPMDKIDTIEIDPSQRMADLDRENNVWKK